MPRKRSKARPWYVDFFRQGFYYRSWAPPDRFQQTEQEVEFIVQVLRLPPGAAILDLCCGQGRHTMALAQQGFQMTGLDLSALHLRLARRTAKEAGVNVRWHRADMREIPWEREFDTAINMFTSFGYLESEEEDQKVLDGVARSLKPGGRFLIDTINWQWETRRHRSPMRQELPDGALYEWRTEIDLEQGRRRQYEVVTEEDGAKHEYVAETRLYSLEELSEMLQAAGLAFCRVWGDYGGHEYSLDSPRMIVLAEKVEG
ncbi:MAG: methyltransferase domain-containing protein [Chloroflexota bacterium]|nr:methyltransferase domain-containing protein [Chloroflexota bacterium]